jgi:hypothetical protein
MEILKTHRKVMSGCQELSDSEVRRIVQQALRSDPRWSQSGTLVGLRSPWQSGGK